MSDTQGANLEGNMPGIGTAPPTTGIARSPLQLPSALQGLAGFFQQTQKPPPKFQPPKPPVLTEKQANQRPEHTGGAASMAPVPPTIPVPTGGFSPYIKTQDRRDPNQWGDPVRFQRLPATFEVTPLFHSIGQMLSGAGGDVGEAASGLTYHSANYWKGFMLGQDHMMKMAREGQALHSAQLEEALTNRILNHKNTVAEYLRAAGGDGAKLATVKINGVSLYDALHDNAFRDGDTNAQAMFENGEPLEHIMNYLADADKNLRDLQAARTKAADQEAEDAAAYGVGPLAGGTASEQGEGTRLLHDKPGEAQADPEQRQPAKADTADTPDWAKGLDPVVVGAVEDRFRGAPRDPKENKYLARSADEKEKLLEAEVNKLLDDAHAGRVKPNEVMDKLRKIAGSRIADDAEGVAKYKRPGFGSGAGTGGRNSDYFQMLDNIAAAADPPDPDRGHRGFIANSYTEQQNFINSPSIRLVQDRINALPADADEIKRDVLILKQKGYSMNDLNWKGIEDSWLGGNMDFQKIRSDMMAYSTAFQTIQGGGKATLGGTRDVEATFPPQSPLATYFNVIKGHMGDIRGQILAKHKDWESRGGDPAFMPRGDKDIEKQIDDYWRMDPKSGAKPYDPKNPDNDRIKKKAGPWGPAGEYYWTDADPINRDNPKNWKRVE